MYTLDLDSLKLTFYKTYSNVLFVSQKVMVNLDDAKKLCVSAAKNFFCVEVVYGSAGNIIVKNFNF